MATSFTFDETVAACDLCGGPKLSTIDSDARIVECTDCGYRFVSPRPSQDEIAASYSASDFYDGWIQDDAGRKRMWSKRLSLLRRAGAHPRLLDIGAGIGTFLSLARDQLGWTVAGTEVSSSAIKIAQERHGLTLLKGQVEELALPPASFDVITLWHVLEHVPSPSLTLAVCNRLLAPGGWLAIAVPNDDEARSSLVATKARLRSSARPPRYEGLVPGDEVHLSHFQSQVLKRALEARGFSVERVTLDDQYACPDVRSESLIRAYRLIHSVSRLNLGQATFVLARKKG